jgi:hypothetical protein
MRGVDERDVDVLSLAGAVARTQRAQRPDHDEQRRRGVADRSARLHRLAVGHAARVHQPAERLGRRIDPGAARMGPGLPERRDRDEDRPGVALVERLPVQSERGLERSADVLDDDVGPSDERAQDGGARGGRDVRDDAPLAAVDADEEAAVARPLLTEAARLVAGRRLELDDVRSEVAEQRRAVRAGHHRGDLEHPDTGEWSGHRTQL